jgi:hypothetical protein
MRRILLFSQFEAYARKITFAIRVGGLLSRSNDAWSILGRSLLIAKKCKAEPSLRSA